jgi:ABC-type cobalamin/Fe3+-siderophores transport system ATPase subunit
MVAILKDGRLAKAGPPDEVITEESMKATYGVDVRIVALEEGGHRKACFPALLSRQVAKKLPAEIR